MDFYAKHVLPHLIDLATRNREAERLRKEWIPQAHGDVLEAVMGSGLNLPFYSRGVSRIYGVGTSLELQNISRANAEVQTPRRSYSFASEWRRDYRWQTNRSAPS